MHEFACVPGFYCYGYCYGSTPPLFYGPGASLHMTVLRASTYSSLGVEKNIGAVYEIPKSGHAAPQSVMPGCSGQS